MMTKECNKCLERKVLAQFRVSNTRPDGLDISCRSCIRQYELDYKHRTKPKKRAEILKGWRTQNLRRKFGISLEQYNEMLRNQSNKCAMCGSENSSTNNKKNFAVDHCHTTGKIRGLLCFGCNAGLGHFGDNIDRLKSAIKYLVDTSPNPVHSTDTTTHQSETER